jgi:hypothetical protein
MPNYQLGKIYKMVCNTTGLTYYGSTCEPTLARRLAVHVHVHKCRKSGKKSTIYTSIKVMEAGNYTIVLVESFPCDSKMELHRRERYYIENNECVNKVIPTRTVEEWRLVNKEKLNKKQNEYNILNREKINKRQIEYSLLHREKNVEYQVEYRLKNKEKLRDFNKILTTCALCGSTHTKVNKSKHLKSNKHKQCLILKSNPPLGEITE